ncbi:hypothetical protein K6U06_20025 [Acidiferrimicrobium sp. IK]|uniref:DUF4286 family protein n=1 Tax=Acidiferrimicrobium sp. IK TaxID=2871700 RepID=UPI0021CB2F86|nr:DUF4286 family protein [Acidiferrimicrobium sp. IK]MCU4186663.1 hypothetical protein [Acidiferrimicrobium sp. IK]
MADANLFLVLSNPVDGRESEFEKWYEEVHLGEVLAVPGVVSAQRFKMAQGPNDELMPPPPHRYLAVYELDRTPAEVLGSFLERVGSGQMVLSESLDLAGVVMHAWTPAGPKHVETAG